MKNEVNRALVAKKKVLLFFFALLALTSCEKDPQPGSYARETTINLTQPTNP